MSVTKTEDFNKLNIEMGKYNFECYQHRLIKRVSRFAFEIYNNKYTPLNLKTSLTRNSAQKTGEYNLRNSSLFYIPSKEKLNDRMESTLVYFYSKLLNEFLLLDLSFIIN